ncbi:MAG: hypothetical protein CM1200mP2_56250 [Planctomycetaceae bacterium]|nr:MAG: hypothetical protein CM1200mP2_56250 [Planctomycetaceae bacterium]
MKTGLLGRVMQRKYDQEELRIVVTKDNVAILGGPRGTLYGVYRSWKTISACGF